MTAGSAIAAPATKALAVAMAAHRVGFSGMVMGVLVRVGQDSKARASHESGATLDNAPAARRLTARAVASIETSFP
jgi:hypothetical protein